MTSTCSHCGHENEQKDRFCGGCARPLDREAFGAGAPPRSDSSAPSDRQSQTGTKGQAPKAIILTSILFALGPILFFVFGTGGGGCSGSVEGNLRSTGQPHGDYTLNPTSCFSGEHESFFGVWVATDLRDENGRSGFKGGLKLVKAHTGQWEAYLESPLECQSFNCVTRQIDPAHCTVYEIDVRNTSTEINDIRVREGTARLECTFPEGGTLSANLKFDGCS